MNQSITIGQLWLAVAFPSAISLASTAIAIVGLMINNGRFNTIEGRLLGIDSTIGDIRERVAKIEVRLDNIEKHLDPVLVKP